MTDHYVSPVLPIPILSPPKRKRVYAPFGKYLLVSAEDAEDGGIRPHVRKDGTESMILRPAERRTTERLARVTSMGALVADRSLQGKLVSFAALGVRDAGDQCWFITEADIYAVVEELADESD